MKGVGLPEAILHFALCAFSMSEPSALEAI